MLKKTLSIILILSCIVCIFSSCSNGEGEDLYYPIYADPVSFDPQIAADNASKIVVLNCFEGLVRPSSDGSVLPGVAESWTISDDGLTYTFKLRNDAKWYVSKYAMELLSEDKRESFNYSVLAEDFVYGLQRAFDKNTGAVTDSRLFSIENSYDVLKGDKPASELGVSAIDSKTLEIRLSEPHEDFLSALTQTAAMPCREEFFLATKGRYGLDPEKVIYNGPFYLYSWSVGTNLVLMKNQSYTGESSVKPNAVYLYVNDDLSTRIDKLIDGTYDACPLSVRQKEAIESDDISYTSYDNTTWGFAFNCQGDITSNLNIRKALLNSINPSSLPKPEACKDYAQGLVPDICMAGTKTFRERAGKIDLTKTNSSFAELCLNDAFDELGVSSVSIEIICLDSFKESVKLAVQEWQKTLGVHINFTITELDEITLEKRYKSGEYDIAFTKITAESDSALSFLSMFTSNSPLNYFNFVSAKYDSLLGTENQKYTQAQAITNCIAAEKHLTELAVFIPVFKEESFLAEAEKVDGIFSTEAGCVPIFIDGIRK